MKGYRPILSEILDDKNRVRDLRKGYKFLLCGRGTRRIEKDDIDEIQKILYINEHNMPSFYLAKDEPEYVLNLLPGTLVGEGTNYIAVVVGVEAEDKEKAYEKIKEFSKYLP